MTGIPDGSDPAELATWLFDRARLGEAQRLAAYVDAGAPVDLTDAEGNTLLMLAAYHGHADTVRALLQRGADPDALNDRGQSPLAGAVFKQEADVIAALLEGGADPDAGTPSARATAQMFGVSLVEPTSSARRPECSRGTSERIEGSGVETTERTNLQ